MGVALARVNSAAAGGLDPYRDNDFGLTHENRRAGCSVNNISGAHSRETSSAEVSFKILQSSSYSCI